MSVPNVAIVGSNGFIAGHLICHLQNAGNFSLRLFGKGQYSAFEKKFRYNAIDFDDIGSMEEQFTGCDIVYHLVSATIPATSWNDPLKDIELNLIPFTRFLQAVSAAKVRKVAFVSSAGTVYGHTQGKVKEDSDKQPFSPYGIVKLAMENLLRHYEVRCGLNYDVYRVSNVYGEGQDTSKGLGIINTFLEAIIREGTVRIFGDGTNMRNYIYVGDVARLLAHSAKDHGTTGIFNISSPDSLTINELVEVIRKATRADFTVEYTEQRKSDNPFIDLDNSRILSLYGDFEFTTLEEGIRTTFNVLKEAIAEKK